MSEINAIGWGLIVGTAASVYYIAVAEAWMKMRLSDWAASIAVIAPPILLGVAMVMA